MKKHIPILFLMFFVGTCVSQAQYQNLMIRLNDASQYRKPLVFMEKFYFYDNNLIVDFKGDSSESFSVSTINKLFFRETESGIDDTKQYNPIVVYPNPTNDRIFIKDMPENISEIYFYNVEGKIVMSCQVPDDNSPINISQLSAGIYFIRIGKHIVRFERI
jgi:hypothetical protein